MRPLQHHFLAHAPLPAPDLARMMPLPVYLCPFLLWWTHGDKLTAGMPFRNDAPLATITTDASLTGWGVTWNDQVAVGVWSQTEAAQHKNVLQTQPVLMSIQHWQWVP